MNGQNPREIAIRVLKQRQTRREYVENLLDKELLAATSISTLDRALCQELVYGIVRWQDTLDWLIHRKTDGRDQNFTLKLLLQSGLYQIFWLDKIPSHAAVHETVELAKQFGFAPKSGFVNALLRGYVREMNATKELLQDLKTKNPALGYSHPNWLVQRWLNRYGTQNTTQLLEWNNTPPGVFARLNTLKTDAQTLVRAWEQEEVPFNIRYWDWTGENTVFELQGRRSVAHLRSFKEGYFYIQDPSTLLAVRALNPQPDENILDACAAPGGKTTYIAQLMHNRGHIQAGDNNEQRLKLVEENCHRLGVTCVTTSPVTNAPTKKFDRILVDTPCSNTGVLRRRVDLRWLIRPEEITRAATAQLEILDKAAPSLKPGGTLVYSTCSLEPEENHALVQQFLKTHPQFHLANERQLLPFTDDADGAYVATLESVDTPH